MPRIASARRVLDRFSAVDGGLLAAGVAYNAVLALIPLALLASSLAGFLLNDPARQADVVAAVVSIAPPLAGVIDEVLAGLRAASPSLSVIGLVLAAWGTSRLFSALESAIGQMFAGTPRLGFVHRTARRVASIAVLAVMLLVALLGAPAIAIVGDIAALSGPLDQVLGSAFLLFPVVVTSLALTAVYRFIPPARPSWRAIRLPAVVGGLGLVGLTRLFVFLTPRMFGANFVYGTLGAILISLAWLNLVFTAILIGAAWVRERAISEDAAVV